VADLRRQLAGQRAADVPDMPQDLVGIPK
jgi:hypothetical protein